MYQITEAEREAERLEADHIWRGFTPPVVPAQCQGKPLPISAKPVKLNHVWWISDISNVVESCGKQTCRVCSPDHGPYEYGVVQ